MISIGDDEDCDRTGRHSGGGGGAVQGQREKTADDYTDNILAHPAYRKFNEKNALRHTHTSID